MLYERYIFRLIGKLIPGKSTQIFLVVIIAVAMVDPVAQDPLYHVFADRRPMAGIPNFMNVMSNLPFLIVGILGWRMIASNAETVTPATRLAWIIFFFGISLTAFGSGYFHLDPNDDTLVWDRIPMTIGFLKNWLCRFVFLMNIQSIV